MVPALAVVLLLAAPSRSLEVSMKKAGALYDKADWDAALRELTIAEKHAATDADRLRVLLFQGAVLANIPDPDAAAAAWERALTIDADAQLPVKVTPKILAEYSRLQRAARSMRERFQKRLDELQRRADTPVQAKLEPPPAPPPPPERPVPLVPLIALGVGVVAGAVGIGTGVVAQQQTQAVRMAEFADEKAALYARASTTATLANFAYGLAAVAALTAFIVLLVSR